MQFSEGFAIDFRTSPFLLQASIFDGLKHHLSLFGAHFRAKLRSCGGLRAFLAGFKALLLFAYKQEKRALGIKSTSIYLELAFPYCTQKQKRLKTCQEGPTTPTGAQLGPNMGHKWAHNQLTLCFKPSKIEA